MAVCPDCGKEVRDDIWVCGHCGALMAEAGSAGRPAMTPSVGPAGASFPTASVGPAGASFPAASPAYAPSGPATGLPGSVYGSMGQSYGAAMEPGLAGGYGAPLGGGGHVGQPLSGPLPSKPAKAAKAGGASRAILIAALLGFVAVIAIVAVWFFVLRGGGGGDIAPYVGQWQLTVPNSTMSESFVITDTDEGPRLSLSVAQTGQVTVPQMAGPYKLEFDGDRVYTTFEPADDASEEQKMAAEMLKSAFGSMVDDFKMVFATGASPDTITLSIDGDLKGGSGSLASLGGQTVELTRMAGTQ